MGKKLTVTVAPVNRPELEYNVTVEQVDKETLDTLAEAARTKWWQEVAEQLQLHVAIEAGKEEGRYGSGEMSDEEFAQRALREAYGEEPA